MREQCTKPLLGYIHEPDAPGSPGAFTIPFTHQDGYSNRAQQQLYDVGEQALHELALWMV